MCNIADLKRNIKTITSESFSEEALRLFRFQAENNLLYKQYIDAIKVDVASVKTIEAIPFLPINYYKLHAVKTGEWQEKAIFESSGTTGMESSKHFVEDVAFYHTLAQKIFETQIMPLNECVILALLPSYIEKGNSSLISMVQYFIGKTVSEQSGFFLYEHKELIQKMKALVARGKKVILWGVTYALLDLVEMNDIDLSNVLVMETGGMKGRREEYVCAEVHAILREKGGAKSIASEYGMTELMSQAYSINDHNYISPPWMKVLVRDISDPFQVGQLNQAGAINIIDLANVHSCAFIETQDIGKVNADGIFEVLGRMDFSDIRGCSLLTI